MSAAISPLAGKPAPPSLLVNVPQLVSAYYTEAPGRHAARPSGTEDVDKIYAESFQSTDHLHQIQSEAQTTVDTFLNKLR